LKSVDIGQELDFAMSHAAANFRQEVPAPFSLKTLSSIFISAVVIGGESVVAPPGQADPTIQSAAIHHGNYFEPELIQS
jgi:hypothetical protein